MQLRRLWKAGMVAALIGTVALVAAACTGSQPSPTPQVAKNLIVYADTVTGSGGTLKAAAVCVLGSQFKRGSHVVWRVKVYDPATGQPMDDTTLNSVQVKLPDGQVFDAKYGDHPANNPTDQFWATSWVIPDNYATGSLPYEVAVQGVDGRTGKFTEFNVAPSLLTIIQ